MDNETNMLLVEQQKTNALLAQLVQENHKRNRSDKRHFWIGLLWHSVPLILSLILIWQTYNFVTTQVNTIQDKVNNTLNFDKIKNNIGTLFN
jgi:hypothetical protein